MRYLTCLAGVMALGFFCSIPRAEASPIAYNGNLYLLTTSAESWTTAEAEAIADGGHLASLHSAADENFILANFVSGANSTDAVWIGFYDPVLHDGGGATHAGDFLWSDGSAINFTHWSTITPEPTNAGDIEYYAALNWFDLDFGEYGTWNDTPVGGTGVTSPGPVGPYFGIIEIPQNIPEPSSVVILTIGLIGLRFSVRNRWPLRAKT